MTQSPHREPEVVNAADWKRANDFGDFLDSLWAMPSARAASLRPQPPTAFSRSGIAIAKGEAK